MTTKLYQDLLKLNEESQKTKDHFRNLRLQKRGLEISRQELFEPILKNQNLQNELLLKSIEENKANSNNVVQFPVQNQNTGVNNSFFILHAESGNIKTYRMKTRDSAQLKYDVNNPHEIEILHNDPNKDPTKIKLTDGLSELLFKKNPDHSKITEDDVNNYFNVYIELKEKPGDSKRINNVIRSFNNPELNQFLKSYNKFSKGKGIGRSLIVLSNDKKQLFERLNILLAAKKQGHNSSIEEITGILDQLLKMKAITLKQYGKFIR